MRAQLGRERQNPRAHPVQEGVRSARCRRRWHCDRRGVLCGACRPPPPPSVCDGARLYGTGLRRGRRPGGHGCLASERMGRRDDERIYREVATAVATGKVVGWFQGAMEFGPRALGNRSIVADPRRADMKDILNTRIKHRETYRPFAPSVLEERVGEYFERNEPSPFMLMVYKVREERRAESPAVTHVDNTGRLQTVSAKTNPRYHALISEFERQTGVGLVLNTSFNEHEPIVATPTDAINCYLKTRMDVLALGNWLLTRG